MTLQRDAAEPNLLIFVKSRIGVSIGHDWKLQLVKQKPQPNPSRTNCIKKKCLEKKRFLALETKSCLSIIYIVIILSNLFIYFFFFFNFWLWSLMALQCFKGSMFPNIIFHRTLLASKNILLAFCLCTKAILIFSWFCTLGMCG